jgi:predicted MPP superfamily phosphohydrolase
MGSRALFFTIIFGTVFLLQTITFITFRRFLKRKGLTSKAWTIASIAPFIIFLLPFIYLLTGGRNFNGLPPAVYNFYIIPFFIFQGAILFIGLWLLIGKIIKAPFMAANYIISRFDTGKKNLEKFKNKKSVQKFDRSRRKFITASTAAVSGYAFVGAGMGVLARDNFEFSEEEVKIANLPPELRGTTITLVADIHSGPYMDEALMKDCMDAINNVGSDIIMISGDLTNSQRDEARPFAKVFRDLKAKHGVYATLGNHDYFSDPNFVAEVVLKDTPIKLLRNEADYIKINNKELCLLGVEDTRRSNAEYDPVIFQNFDITAANAVDKAAKQGLSYDTLPKILLYHKPYFLKEFEKKGMDLILSGHTHGGQVVLAKFGSVNLSLAATVSPYVSGLYKHGKTQMYVSKGIGVVALPIRLNCRPEITKLTLV